MYDGYVESPAMTQARRQRILDAQEQARQARENAEIGEWLGTHFGIVGGEIVELEPQQGDEEIPF